MAYAGKEGYMLDCEQFHSELRHHMDMMTDTLALQAMICKTSGYTEERIITNLAFARKFRTQRREEQGVP